MTHQIWKSNTLSNLVCLIHRSRRKWLVNLVVGIIQTIASRYHPSCSSNRSNGLNNPSFISFFGTVSVQDTTDCTPPSVSIRVSREFLSSLLWICWFCWLCSHTSDAFHHWKRLNCRGECRFFLFFNHSVLIHREKVHTAVDSIMLIFILQWTYKLRRRDFYSTGTRKRVA